MKFQTTEQKIFNVLRIAIAMCFIGHGSFGIITKPIWCNYFAVFGIDKVMAFKLMPWLGSVDIAFGLIMLVYPIRAVALWLVIWGLITAALRPLSGEPFPELIERAGNFGAPLALLLLVGAGEGFKGWFTRISEDIKADERKLKLITNALKVVVFLLLAGHGWLNLIEKKGIMGQYKSLGFSNPAMVAHIVGVFEIVAALSILIKPIRPVLLILLIWKAATELFYPHWELFEWIERGGSYCTLLALWIVLPSVSAKYSKTKLAIN